MAKATKPKPTRPQPKPMDGTIPPSGTPAIPPGH